MFIPDEIRKCVAFVAGKTKAGMAFQGTAFFLSRPVPGTDKESFMYAVTARHVIEKIASRGGTEIYLRLNTAIGGVCWAETRLVDWTFHPTDATVDVAVCRFLLSSQVDHLACDVRMAVTDERTQEHQIGLGDEVFVVGLFSQHTGQNRNIPIVRIGNIAAQPEEPINSGPNSPRHAYLVEARSIGGLSGSPVFVNLGTQRAKDNTIRFSQNPVYFLFGLMHGHWDWPVASGRDVRSDTVRVDPASIERVNMGIAIVVPVSQVLEALAHPRLREPESDLLRSRGLPTQ